MSLYKTTLKILENSTNQEIIDQLCLVWFDTWSEYDNLCEDFYHFGQAAMPKEIVQMILGSMRLGWAMREEYDRKRNT